MNELLQKHHLPRGGVGFRAQAVEVHAGRKSLGVPSDDVLADTFRSEDEFREVPTCHVEVVSVDGPGLAASGSSVPLFIFQENPDDGGMPLSRKAIEDLKAIYRKEHHRELSDDEAHAIGNTVLHAYFLATRPRNHALKSSNGVPFDRPRP